MVKKTIQRAQTHLKKRDKILAKIIVEVGQCNLGINPRPPFDALVSSIISQQLSAKAADTIKSRVISRLKSERPFSAEIFARAKKSQLRACGLSQSKSEFILRLAKRVSRGELDLGAIADCDDESAIQALTKEHGIGRWTAEMFLIFALGRTDVFSFADAGIRRAIQIFYEFPDRPSDIDIEKISLNWRPYRSYACWYLWQHLDNQSGRNKKES
jgi:DNA-3-methyladenine glycosylase II